MKTLEQHGLVELVEERRKGNMTERVVRASAAAYVISPAALAAVAPDPARSLDRLSARWLLALAARLVRETGALINGASRANKPLATFGLRGEITVDATPDQVWDAIASGPGVDSWLMGHTEIDSDSKTSTFEMFGDTATSAITVWEPGHRYATQEERNPDGTFMAFEWLIEARDGGGAVVRFVHSGLLGENWEAEYNALSVGDHAYANKLAVYLSHFAPRTAKLSMFLPGPTTKDSWAAMTAAVGARTDAANGQPARLTVPGIEPVDGVVEFVASPSFVGMRTDEAMYMLIHGYNDMMFASAHYFDDRDRSTETEAWQAWLSTLA